MTEKHEKRKTTEQTTILFDGDCALCNGLTRWVAKRDQRHRLTLLPMQSPAGKTLVIDPCRHEAPYPPRKAAATIIVMKKNRIFTKSDAAIEIALALGGIWKLAWIFTFIPRPVRNAVYDWIARNRIKWFGKSDRCELP